jgi:ferritin-like metal-binding protein YciE
MAIRTLEEKFQHELQDIYDAEHQFANALQEMMGAATDSTLKEMLNKHLQQTQGHITNLEQIFNLMGAPAQRVMCDGAKGIVSEGQKLIKETQGSPELCDTAILGAASKAEHYEIASYRGLILGAKIMGQSQVINFLQQNLAQEEQTAQLIEQTEPGMIQRAISAQGGMTMNTQGGYGQSTQAR